MLPFSREYLLTPLHWILSDKECSITIETVQDGLKIYDNPVGVLTNSPPFLYHLDHLADYKYLTNEDTKSEFCGVDVGRYSAGLGAVGLPGDYSSTSRFVRAAFIKCNSLSNGTERDNVCHFFHMLSAVAMPRGSILVDNGQPEITLYSSCCNTEKGIYYYTTYENSRITSVDMNRENLNAETLITYPLRKFSEIFMQN
jgi:choloylglycine hydrolase